MTIHEATRVSLAMNFIKYGIKRKDPAFFLRALQILNEIKPQVDEALALLDEVQNV